MLNKLLTSFRDKATALDRDIVFAEAVSDSRTFKAARMFVDEKLGTPILIGSPHDLLAAAAKARVSLDSMTMIDPDTYGPFPQMVTMYQDQRAKDNLSDEEVRGLLHDPLWFGAMLVQMDQAHGMVAGATNTTSEVLRAAIRCVGLREGNSTVSSFFLMLLNEDSPFGEDGALFFADCAVIPTPTLAQLVDIGDSTALSFRQLMETHPRVAYLSFSNKGSAKTKESQHVSMAARLLAERHSTLAVDGELQADSALAETIANMNAPGSQVAGKANTLIFPDLNSANIAYKLVQQLAGAQAIGPIIQGLSKPINDVARGCTTSDIVQVATLTALQSS